MRFSFLSLLAAAAVGTLALATPVATDTTEVASIPSRTSLLSAIESASLFLRMPNSKWCRKCWGKHNINTNFYDTIFHTGRTREYWLNVEEIDCAPDGYKRRCQVVNGTMPGPAIVADWGDDLVIHVKNNMASNGTAIHWHGIRQLHNTQYDGVPGVSQCPIAPGSTFTYKFHASQYGTTIYHSHFSLQYSMGLYGPLIINGPATSNYDEDLGAIILSDWDHRTAYQIWASTANFAVVDVGTGLVHGMNTNNCVANNATAQDPNCISGGKKYELAFKRGTKYRLRIVNLGTEAWFQFSIDGHRMTVIETDFVPVVPYETDSIQVNMGQRYDIIVEANATPGDYWIRGGFQSACIPNGDPDNITGILRYNAASTADPTTVSTVVQRNNCLDEPPANLVPWLPVDLTNMDGGIELMDFTGEFYQGKYLRWAIDHGSFMWANWSDPVLGDVIAGEPNIPSTNNVFQFGMVANASNASPTFTLKSGSEQWAVLVIDDLTPVADISHPIHLHGHDFLVLGASASHWDGTTIGWQLTNPPRRDVATLPPNGHLVIAWLLDNPGLWLLHCHTAWHSSQGFAASFLESAPLIAGLGGTSDWEDVFVPGCEAWEEWEKTMPFEQDDSGI